MVIPALVSASTDARLRGAPMGVYVWLLCHRLDVATFRTCKVDALVYALKVRRSTASRALRALVDCGYLERRGHPATGYEYRLTLTHQSYPE